MTRIDFYLLPADVLGDAAAGIVPTVCRLCDKATAQGLKLYLHVPDAALADDLDGALWSQRQGSFISHERYRGKPAEEPQPMALIGDLEPPSTHLDVLFNLAPEVPAFFSRFERVLEVVPGDAEARERCRERYKFYRDRGYELKTYEQTAEGGWALKNK